MRAPTRVSDPDVKAITVFLASTATPERGALPYLDAVLPAEDRLAATRVVRDLGALPPDAILYLLAQPLLDLAITSCGTAPSRLGTRRASRSRPATNGWPRWGNTSRGGCDHRRPLSRPGGGGGGAPLPHGSAGLRPPDGAWAATFLRGAEPARTRLISGRRASSTDPSPGCAKARSALGALQP